MIKKIFLLSFLSFIIVSFLFSLGVYYLIHKPGPLEKEITIIIPKGSSVTKIAYKLEEKGVIYSRWAFRITAYILQSKYRPKAGEFAFIPQQSSLDVLRHIASGKVVQHKFVIPEGTTSAVVVGWLKANDLLSGNLPKLPPEGSLLPETYFYTYGEKRVDLIQRMQKAMDALTGKLWQKRPSQFPLTTKELIVLASIIEKETRLDKERRHIAGVFHNRLRRGMRLQADPTVIYALTSGHDTLDRPLTKEDLNFSSPYNTYLYPHLPPTAICNPGRASLEAALNPLTTKDLYFVADGTGGHVFSATYEDHLRNVKRLRSLQNNNIN